MHPEEQAAWDPFKDAINTGVETGIGSARMDDLQGLTKRLLETLASVQEKQKAERQSEATKQADATMPDGAAALSVDGTANPGQQQG